MAFVFVNGVLVGMPRGLPAFPGAEAVRMCRRAAVDLFGRYDTRTGTGGKNTTVP